MDKKTKIYIAGHEGMVGSAIWRKLESKGYSNLIGLSFKKLDLRNQQAVNNFFKLGCKRLDLYRFNNLWKYSSFLDLIILFAVKIASFSS